MEKINHVELLGKGCVTKSFWGNKRYLSAVCADTNSVGKLILKFDFPNGYTASIIHDIDVCKRTGADIWFVNAEWPIDPSESPIHQPVDFGNKAFCFTPKQVKQAINFIKKLPPRE